LLTQAISTETEHYKRNEAIHLNGPSPALKDIFNFSEDPVTTVLEKAIAGTIRRPHPERTRRSIIFSLEHSADAAP
jgi:hypothetical protein